MTHFSTWCWKDTEVLYSDNCHSSKHLFGCISMRRKQSCILNKQYSEQDYEVLLVRLVGRMQEAGEWGEFFPSRFSPFAYNESRAQDIFPMLREEAEREGCSWKEPEARPSRPQNVEIPDDIRDVPDSLVRAILVCAACGKNYRIMPRELSICRKVEVPVPRSCPDCRRRARFARYPIDGRMHEQTCFSCGRSTKTAYAPNRPERIACEQCYLELRYS